MDTIETITRNAHALSEAHIDWSPDGGMFWLTGMLLIAVATMAVAAWNEGVN